MSIVTGQYTEQRRRSDITAALGGELYWLGSTLFWRPPLSAVVIRLTYHTPNERFDAEEYATALWNSWHAHGAWV